MSKVAAFIKRLGGEEATRTRLVYAWELPSIMRKHILTGAMGTVYIALLAGMYLVAFGNAIGLTYWQWGLLSAASSLALVLQLVSAYLVVRIGSRRFLWYLAALCSRLLRALAVTLAFALTSASPGAARAVFIGLLVLSSCFDAIAAPPWLSWLGDIIPPEQHGQFLGRRNAWIALANMSIVVPIGYVVDRVDERWKMTALMVVFGFAFAVGVLDLVIHKTIPEPPMKMPPRREFWHEVMAPIGDRTYRPWLVFNACWNFSMSFGGSLAMVYFVENLGIKRNFLGGSIVLIMLPLAGTILLGRQLGTLVDRHGVRWTLKWGHRFWALLPLFWIVATPRTAFVWLGVAGVLAELSAGTALTAANKLVVRAPPPGHVPMYVAVSSCVGNLAGAAAALLSGFLLHGMEHMSWTVAGQSVGGFHVLFAGSLLLRGACTLLVRRIHEPPLRSGSVTDSPSTDSSEAGRRAAA